MEEKKLLCLDTKLIRKSLKMFYIKQIGCDLFVSFCVSLLFLVLWALFGQYNSPIPEHFLLICISLIVFLLIEVCTFLIQKATKNKSYFLIRKKLSGKHILGGTGVNDDGVEYNYLTFFCLEYGALDYLTDGNSYDIAKVGEDEYYLVIVKKRFSKKYKIAKIFLTKEYELSAELEKIVKSI